MKNEIVLFTDGDVDIEVQINPEQETVWLTQKQMEVLFDVKHATVSEHISNILASGELDETSVGFSDRSTGGRKPKIYNLDMILSVGYRVNSKRGIAFRKWANNVLKQFILQGYAINEKRLQALKKTVDIQSRMLADALDIEEKDVLRAVNEYTDALILLENGKSEEEALHILSERSRDNSRTPMQWSAEKNAGFSQAEPKVVWQSEWNSYELLLGNYSDGKVDGTLRPYECKMMRSI